ncbi:MAG: hypothetical protein E6G94_07815 [Alphaproteobacteria bacterium]|nr:MAG: hypothetical protein E6G94_07815 [Alphaproteobacteria bacterium]
MKKGHGLARAVAPMGRDELANLPTGALLARLKRLRWCEDRPDHSDLLPEEIESAGGMILFKTDAAWRSAYAEVKDVLAGREHVANKP